MSQINIGQINIGRDDMGEPAIDLSFLSAPIYNRDRTPASPQAQSRVDRLIDYVNQQIELLAFDEPDTFVLRQMVQCLVDPRRATRLNLVESFSQIGEPATPFLLEGIAHHEEPVVRRACCNALTNIGDPESVPALIAALLKDGDISVKSAAAGALAKVGAPAFEALRDVLASDEASESCKGHAAWALASMSSEVSDRLYRLIGHPSASVRTAVIGAIAQHVQKQIAQKQLAQTQSASQQPGTEPVRLEVGTPHKGHLASTSNSSKASASNVAANKADTPQAARLPRSEKIQYALTLLTEALNDQSSEVRIEAAATLARLNCQKAYQPLIACLKDPTAAVRKAAALALAKLGNPAAIGAISQLQRDAEESVRKVASLVIDQLEAKQPERQPKVR
ncbi:MAG: HEAT repeat domain-containing protein [Cyanobacteria bacterium P01_A01_bin.116]